MQRPIAILLAVLVATIFFVVRSSTNAQTEATAEKPTATGLVSAVDEAVRRWINERYGTIDAPVIRQELPIDFGSTDRSANRANGWKLEAGRAVYKAHCERCHGESGAGDGSAAPADAFPRDFTRGIFKWTSTKPGVRVTRHDLRETLRLGDPDSGMPAFSTLKDEQVDAVVEFVRWLAIRGEVGHELSARLKSRFDQAVQQAAIRSGIPQQQLDDEAQKYVDETFEPLAEYVASTITDGWSVAELESNVLRIKANRLRSTPESIARGRRLFASKTTRCTVCHGSTAHGDGPATRRVEYIQGEAPLKRRLTPGLHDVWNDPIKPADLTQGAFRGGASRSDLFRRIACGIKGTSMPALTGVLSEEEIHDLVDYAMSLSKPDTSVARNEPRRGLADDAIKLIAATSPDSESRANTAHLLLGGTGTFTGKILYGGTPPKLAPIVLKGKAPKDPDVCAADADIPDESLIVDPKTRGIANVFVYLETAPPGVPVPPTPKTPIYFTRRDCRFSPHALIARSGQPIHPRNEDKVAGTVHSYPIRNSPFNVLIPANSRKATPQVYPNSERVPFRVLSDIQSWMKAYQLILDHPWGAVTDSQGGFEIRGLPAGVHSFRIWHESAGYLDRDFRVEMSSGATKTVSISYPATKFAIVGGK